MRNLVLCFFLSCCCLGTKAGEMVISGVYQGKDLYVQNPFLPALKAFCTEEVFVNDRQVLTQPRTSAYKIDLSYLNMHDIVIVRIIYRDDCRPKVVNAHVLKAKEGFRFLFAEADNQSITWATQGEYATGEFHIERLDKNGDWDWIQTVDGKGSRENNQYSILPEHLPGENKYRLKYEPAEDGPVYSVKFAFTSTDDPVNFEINEKSTKITLSRPVAYFITDLNDRKVKEGRGDEIYIGDLRQGGYYLNMENRAERFVKR